MHAVDSFLHSLVIAEAVDGDLVPQISATDLPEDAVAFTDWQQDGIQHLVDTVMISEKTPWKPLTSPRFSN